MDHEPKAGGAPEFDAATTNFVDAVKGLLVCDGLELDRRTIKLTGTNAGESFNARQIIIDEHGQSVIIEQPDTDEQTCRSLLIRVVPENGLYGAYIDVPRDIFEKHHSQELAQLMSDFDAHLDAGEALGLIDKAELVISRQLKARALRESLDRFLMAAEIDLLDPESQSLKQEVEHQRGIESLGKLGLQMGELVAGLYDSEAPRTPQTEAWYRKYRFFVSQEQMLLIHMNQYNQAYAEQFEERRAKVEEEIMAGNSQLRIKAQQIWTIIKLLDAVKNDTSVK